MLEAKTKAMQDRNVSQFIEEAIRLLGDNLISIVFFGSRHRGDHDAMWSDYDFLLLVREPISEDDKLKLRCRLPFPLTIVVRTERALRWAIETLNSVDINAVDEGAVVYGRSIEPFRALLAKTVERYQLRRRPELGKGVWQIGRPQV